MENHVDKLRAEVLALPRPVGLVGFGVEGKETLQFLLEVGGGALSPADIRVFDRALTGEVLESAQQTFPGVVFHNGENWPQLLPECGTLFRSPGLRPDLPGLAEARAAGVRITSAIRFFLAHRPCRAIGVTGTVGKGTTVTLIGEGLRAAGIPCRLGGNIGTNPLVFLQDVTSEEVVVLELSSFQLMDLDDHWPEVAVILRTTSEHLDWHKDRTEYRSAKAQLLAPNGVKQQVIFCADSDGSQEIAAQHKKDGWQVSLEKPVEQGIGRAEGNTAKGGFAKYSANRAEALSELETLAMPGLFNRENAAAALLAVEAVGGDIQKALTAISVFPGLPHRLEKAGEHEGVSFYNDSYATRPDATMGALASFDQPLALILGGSEKNADFSQLAELICTHPSLQQVALIGTTAKRLVEEIQAAAEKLGRPSPVLQKTDSLAEAFNVAKNAIAAGGVVLFSPACASFDMFPNYKVRGERFRALVSDPSEQNDQYENNS